MQRCASWWNLENKAFWACFITTWANYRSLGQEQGKRWSPARSAVRQERVHALLSLPPPPCVCVYVCVRVCLCMAISIIIPQNYATWDTLLTQLSVVIEMVHLRHLKDQYWSQKNWSPPSTTSGAMDNGLQLWALGVIWHNKVSKNGGYRGKEAESPRKKEFWHPCEPLL